MADANSCCCGATKSNPCACMKKMAKTGGKMQCSPKEPMCACYKDKAKIKKAFDTGWVVVKAKCFACGASSAKKVNINGRSGLLCRPCAEQEEQWGA